MVWAVRLLPAGRHAVARESASAQPAEVAQEVALRPGGAAVACQGERPEEAAQEHQEHQVFRGRAHRWEGAWAAAPCLGACLEEAGEPSSGPLREEEPDLAGEEAERQADWGLMGGLAGRAAAEAAGP